MSKRNRIPNQTVIDPLFAIPPGSEDLFVYSDDPINLATAEVDGEEVEEFEGDYPEFDEGDYEEALGDLPVPENFFVIAQNLRRAPGGQQVVDVVIRIEEVEGASDYQIEVAKE